MTATADPQPGHTLEVPTPEAGDVKYTWDPANDTEVAAARAAFDAARAQGMVAFEQAAGPGRGRRLDTFDPQAGQVVMRPQLQGG